jgi:hypothetical protein
MDTEALGRIAAAHLEAADALHRLVEAINSGEAAARLSEAEPVSEHKSRVIPMWINDRLPNEYDSPSSDPRVYQWDATRGVYTVARWDVKPGEWWASGRLEKPTSPPQSQPEPAAEPAPGEWRNDRPPAGSDEDDGGKVWCWYANKSAPTDGGSVRVMYAAGGRLYWSPGNQPAPTSPPPEPPKGKWIVGPQPTEADADFENDVKVPNVLDPTCPYGWAKYYVVQPGAPWCSPDDNPGPWDPTTLDHNGWIRSRLPTVGDAHQSRGRVWIPCDARGHVLQHYTFIVPGQPWAPIDSDLGPYQP